MLGKAMLGVAVVLCFVAVVRSQENKKTPSLPRADDGPSLDVTMKFIQDKLTDQNKIIYEDDTTESDEGTEVDFGVVQHTDELTKVVANPNACQINYHWKSAYSYVGVGVKPNYQVTVDEDFRWNLKDVQNIVVMSGEQNDKRIYMKNGHPHYSSKIDRPVYVLRVELPKYTLLNNVIYFYDDELANRVAKALVHAVELCGGGSKPEPF